jgi:hypothetical protein
MNERSQDVRWPRTLHAAQRFMLEAVAGAAAVDEPNVEHEEYTRADEVPVLAIPRPIESEDFRSIAVPRGESRSTSGFRGFLDGRQVVRVTNYAAGIPIVWGVVNAVVMARINRKLAAWSSLGPLDERRYYLPFRYVSVPDEFTRDAHVVDTSVADPSGAIPTRHPAALLERAFQAVQRDRERLERRLAEHWCVTQDAAIYVDGSITGSRALASSPLAVGVIKSHRTLYAEGDAFRVVTALQPGQRTTVFRIEPGTRSSVASFYVRTRNPAGRGALFGLIRIEISESGDVPARADEVTRWMMTERAPVALPDGRWDRMSYPILGAEQFLRAIS